MRTESSVIELPEIDHDFVSDSDLIGFHAPRDIVHDPVLTLGRKRQLLAYWASDIHAVPSFPSLRSRAHGSTVSIDEIMAALRELDEMVDIAAIRTSAGSGVAA